MSVTVTGPISRRSTRLSWLFLLLLVALTARVAAAFWVQARVDQIPGRLCLIAGDAEGYWELGKKIASGDDYALYDPPRRALRMPGFPLLLAAGMAVVGDSLLGMRLILACMGTVACGLVYWLARELFDGETDGATANGACLLAALAPTFIPFSVMILSETLFALALLASLIALARLVHRSDRGWVSALACGLFCGLATLVRPTWLIAGPAIALGLVVPALWRARGGVITPAVLRRSLAHAALLLAALFVTLLPWGVRNARVTGHFFVTTLWAGPSLYDGLHPGATGSSDMSFIEQDRVYERLSEYDADRHYWRAAWDFAFTNPAAALRLSAVKLWRFWNPVPNAEQFGHWTIRLVSAGFFIPMLVLAALGGLAHRGCLARWLIPVFPILCFSLVHTLFIGSLRYRLPAEYPLLVLAAAGIQRLRGTQAVAVTGGRFS
jgi:4-amino-4-deoxy-L-arabinose transferase-like glycosyltransferase